MPSGSAVEALVRIPPTGLVLLVGLATWLPDGAEVVPDDEHDAYAWWPADVDRVARRRPTSRCG